MTLAARYRSYYAGGALALIASILVFWSLNTYPASQRTERTEAVFVYATLTNPLIRAYACRCFVSSEAAVLPGYYREGRTIIASSSAAVAGAIITVSPRELARLDRYEGTPDKYRRERTTIEGRPIFVYIKNP